MYSFNTISFQNIFIATKTLGLILSSNSQSLPPTALGQHPSAYCVHILTNMELILIDLDYELPLVSGFFHLA